MLVYQRVPTGMILQSWIDVLKPWGDLTLKEVEDEAVSSSKEDTVTASVTVFFSFVPGLFFLVAPSCLGFINKGV